MTYGLDLRQKKLGLDKGVATLKQSAFLPLRIIEVFSLTGFAPLLPTQVRFDPFTGSMTSSVEVKKNRSSRLGSSVLFFRVALYALSGEKTTVPISFDPPKCRVPPVGRIH